MVLSDEGMAGVFVTQKVRGPGKRYRHRKEGFSGCLAITKVRVICCTFGKRQINIAVDDARMAHLFVDTPEDTKLSISFESSNFRDGWEGVIEFRFNTEKANPFRDTLVRFGAQPGTAT